MPFLALPFPLQGLPLQVRPLPHSKPFLIASTRGLYVAITSFTISRNSSYNGIRILPYAELDSSPTRDIHRYIHRGGDVYHANP